MNSWEIFFKQEQQKPKDPFVWQAQAATVFILMHIGGADAIDNRASD